MIDKLYEAIDNSDLNEVKAIIEIFPNYIDQGSKNYVEKTPLMYALAFSTPAIQIFLIESGSNVNAVNLDGKGP